MVKSHRSMVGVIYMQSRKQCALRPSRLSPQWLSVNSCTWAHDVRFT